MSAVDRRRDRLRQTEIACCSSARPVATDPLPTFIVSPPRPEVPRVLSLAIGLRSYGFGAPRAMKRTIRLGVLQVCQTACAFLTLESGLQHHFALIPSQSPAPHRQEIFQGDHRDDASVEKPGFFILIQSPGNQLQVNRALHR